MVKPFKVDISDQIIKDIYDKVKKYPWHEMPNDGGWEYGTNLDYMKEISKYWISEFDWRKHEKENLEESISMYVHTKIKLSKNNNGYSCQAISPFANKQFQYTITSKGLTDQS